MLCRFGGAKKGVEEDVNVGDVMIIPAGLAHQRCLLHMLLDTIISLGQALHVIMSCLPVCKIFSAAFCGGSNARNVSELEEGRQGG